MLSLFINLFLFFQFLFNYFSINHITCLFVNHLWSPICGLSSFCRLPDITHRARNIYIIALIILSLFTIFHVLILLIIQRFWQICNSYFLRWKYYINELFSFKIAGTFPIFNRSRWTLLQLTLTICVVNNWNTLIFLFSFITS